MTVIIKTAFKIRGECIVGSWSRTKKGHSGEGKS